MKCLKPVLTAILIMLACRAAFAQPICAFDHNQEILLKKNLIYKKALAESESRISEYLRTHPVNLSGNARGSSINGTQYTIPVVVHVVHTGGAVGTIYNPSDAQISGAIAYLNNVYNGTYPGIEGVGDLQIQFVLATRDTNCNATTGIDRIDGSAMANYASNGVNSSTSGGVSDLTLKNFDRWDPAVYYNIWVVDKIDGKDGTSGQFIAGYAYFAGAPTALDGTVMLATQMASGQKTLPHEIGHALALYHPFQGSPDAATCPSNTNNNCNLDGDRVCDTDPITYNQTSGVVDFTCRSGTNSCAGTAFTSNTEKNYMNYTSCYTLFTAGQKSRMQAAMSLPSRASLASSYALGGAYPASPFTPASAAGCTPVTSSSGLNGDIAGIMNVALASKSFNSDGASTDRGYIDRSGKCGFVIGMQKNNTYTFSATVLAANNEQLRVWIDYNNDGVFSNSTEQILYASDIPSPGNGSFVNVSTSFTVPTTATAGTVLRMRVMDEVSTVYGYTITGACYNPAYGQAEDYPIYLSALLPVQFAYFTGTKKNNDGWLNWKTTEEENASEFQVEKSMDGVSFIQIGAVAANNDAKGSTYSYTDKSIGQAKNYYRLRQLDKDGKAQLSQVVVLQGETTGLTGIKVLNNPFTDRLDLVCNGAAAGNATISLFDAKGVKLFSRQSKLGGGQTTGLDLSGYALKPGMYILQVQTGSGLFTEKLIKQ